MARSFNEDWDSKSYYAVSTTALAALETLTMHNDNPRVIVTKASEDVHVCDSYTCRKYSHPQCREGITFRSLAEAARWLRLALVETHTKLERGY